MCNKCGNNFYYSYNGSSSNNDSKINCQKIPKGYYFVMGDNRKESSDSRDYRIGLIKKEDIQGRAVFRLTPFKRFGSLKK